MESNGYSSGVGPREITGTGPEDRTGIKCLSCEIHDNEEQSLPAIGSAFRRGGRAHFTGAPSYLIGACPVQFRRTYFTGVGPREITGTGPADRTGA